MRVKGGRERPSAARDREPEVRGEKITVEKVPRYDLSKVAAGSFDYLAKSTQYSLRRGNMSVRLRAGEDAVLIAKSCGASTEMLFHNYADDIAEAGTDTRPLEEPLREALGWSQPDTQRRPRAV